MRIRFEPKSHEKQKFIVLIPGSTPQRRRTKKMTYPFRNLVFEGGGVKGIAYVGAMNVLEKEEILKNIVRVGGTSADSSNTLMIEFSPDICMDHF